MRHRFLVFVFLASPALYAAASGTEENVREGNRLFHQEKYEDALSLYETASVANPESSEIYFNKGTVFYRQGDFRQAIEAFDNAALKTTDLLLEAKAAFNKGNCLFREGERQQDSDMQKALENYGMSIVSFQRALELDPSASDAAHNIEVVRVLIKTLLDEIKKQQEEAQKHQEEIKKFIEILEKLISDEQSEIDGNRLLAEKLSETGLNDELAAGIMSLARNQGDIMEESRTLSQKMETMIQPGRPSPVSTAREHVETSVSHQESAFEVLSGGKDPAAALPAQQAALSELGKALEELTKPPEGNQQQQNQQQAEQSQPQQDTSQPQQDTSQPQQDTSQAQQDTSQAQQDTSQAQQDTSETDAAEQEEADDAQAAAANEAARDILDEERENQLERAQSRSGQYRNVDKDW